MNFIFISASKMFRSQIIVIIEKIKKALKTLKKVWLFPNIIFKVFFPIVGDFDFSEKLKNCKFFWEVFFPFSLSLYLVIESLILICTIGYDPEHCIPDKPSCTKFRYRSGKSWRSWKRVLSCC